MRRRIAIMIAILGCLLCPVHILAILALFGGGKTFSAHGWVLDSYDIVGLVCFLTLFGVVELRHHRQHRCSKHPENHS